MLRNPGCCLFSADRCRELRCGGPPRDCSLAQGGTGNEAEWQRSQADTRYCPATRGRLTRHPPGGLDPFQLNEWFNGGSDPTTPQDGPGKIRNPTGLSGVPTRGCFPTLKWVGTNRFFMSFPGETSFFWGHEKGFEIQSAFSRIVNRICCWDSCCESKRFSGELNPATPV